MTILVPNAIGAMAIATMLSSAPSFAQRSGINQPWCGVDQGATSCLYRSLEECVYIVRPGGGTCIPNPEISDRESEQFDD